ncbi:DUF2059 domain-containing protein [Devosia sp. YIM 151766]|uniref:DUF2059 domain-containing protein n=1 Tax=Devosia sp. YIM 151766 TaxID=3017325 RepID=UPI00255C7EB1|nr:DUF2059 domain-containing protein [Devosia sp. YIM 151766]WIY53728.1 DUF2059 domain-containing protein [Devosia sp. YIM 151766]
MAFWTDGNMMRGAKAVMGAVLAAGLIAMAAPAFAQEVAPEQLALARKYIDLTDRGAVFETTVVEVGIDTMRQIVTQNPEIIDQTNETIGDVIKEYNGRKGELLDQFARVYAMRFTLDELREIVGFYESPTGQKLAAANSEVNADIRRVLQVYTNNLRTEFFAKVRSGLRAKGVEI